MEIEISEEEILFLTRLGILRLLRSRLSVLGLLQLIRIEVEKPKINKIKIS